MYLLGISYIVSGVIFTGIMFYLMFKDYNFILKLKKSTIHLMLNLIYVLMSLTIVILGVMYIFIIYNQL